MGKKYGGAYSETREGSEYKALELLLLKKEGMIETLFTRNSISIDNEKDYIEYFLENFDGKNLAIYSRKIKKSNQIKITGGSYNNIRKSAKYDILSLLLLKKSKTIRVFFSRNSISVDNKKDYIEYFLKYIDINELKKYLSELKKSK